MKNAFYFPVSSKATFGERITVLRENAGIKSIQALAEKMFHELDKYAETGNAETDNSTIESIRKRITSHLKPTCNPKMEFVKEYCDFFQCDSDFLLGYIDFPNRKSEDIYKVTGLNDMAIETLSFLKSNNGSTHAGHNELNTLNLLLSDRMCAAGFLSGLQDFLNIRYKVPVYHSGKRIIVNGYIDDTTASPVDGVSAPECIVPDNIYDIIKGEHGANDTYLLTLARSKDTPYDNYQIPLTTDFLESIALKTIEKYIIDLRNTLKERTDDF